MTKEEIIAELEFVAAAPGFIYTLAVLLRLDLFLDPAQAADINWREKLSIQEFTLLIGLMVKRQVDLSVPSPDAVGKQIETIRRQFAELHRAHMAPMLESFTHALEKGPTSSEGESQEAYRDIFGQGESIAEPIFYGGSGAYDFQFIAFAERRYRRDEAWLREHMGFTVADVQGIPRWLKKRAQDIGNQRGMPANFNEACERALSTFTFSGDDLHSFDKDISARFLEAFSLVPGGANLGLTSVGQFNEINARPIIRLPDGSYFLPIVFLLFQSIYESPFYWMIRDNAYKVIAAKNRGEATEEIAADLLQPVFGAQVRKNIRVQAAKKQTTTDIDTLVVAGNKAIVFQEKSKKLTELARRGDTEALKRDFAAAVQSAYEQGLKSRSAILSRGSKLFDANNNEIHLTEFINEVYIVCLSSDEYPAVISQIEAFLEKSDGDPMPIGMSLFDLDILATYLTDPFEFLYYVRQRTSSSSYFRASSEMSYLGFHLNQKLFPSRDADMMMIAEEFAQLVDANFPSLRGEQARTEAADRLHHKWKNAKFNQLVEDIKATGEPGLTDAVFHLYDLAGAGADDLIKMMEKTALRCASDRSTHDFSMLFGNGRIGISCLMHAGPRSELGPRMMNHAMAKKYKTKIPVWLALGKQVGSDRLIDSLGYSDQPWQYDEGLEVLAGRLKPGTPIGRGGRKIGRNEPCPCGSGKKFKRCCGGAN